MSANFNPLYEQVRQLGLPYQIKESGGSVLIKISSKNFQQFSNSNEKFRFHTSRTLNGSNNQNWRSPQNFQEKSILSGTSFPDINFFRSTPPPSYRSPPPPPPASSCCATPMPTTLSSAVQDPNQTIKIGKLRTELGPDLTFNPPESSSFSLSESLDLSAQPQETHPEVTSTPFNPFRCSRRQILFPRTPDLLLNPSKPPAAQTSCVSITPNSIKPTETNDAGIEAFKKVMEAVYKQTISK